MCQKMIAIESRLDHYLAGVMVTDQQPKIFLVHPALSPCAITCCVEDNSENECGGDGVHRV